MKTVYVKNNIVREVIPEYALPVEEWYGPQFATSCMEVGEEVDQGWGFDPKTGTFARPNLVTGRVPSRAEQLRADVDFLAALQGVIL